MIGARGEVGDQTGAFARVGSAIHAPDMRIARLRAPLHGLRLITAKLTVEVARGIFIISEEQHLLALEITRQQFFESCQLGIVERSDSANSAPDLTQRIHVLAYISMQALEI